MQQLTDYRDLMGEIGEFFESRIAAAVAAGIDKSQIIIDPGIGFAKNLQSKLRNSARVAKIPYFQLSDFSRSIAKKLHRSHFESARSETKSLGDSGGLYRCDRQFGRYLASSRCQRNVRCLFGCRRYLQKSILRSLSIDNFHFPALRIRCHIRHRIHQIVQSF